MNPSSLQAMFWRWLCLLRFDDGKQSSEGTLSEFLGAGSQVSPVTAICEAADNSGHAALRVSGRALPLLDLCSKCPTSQSRHPDCSQRGEHPTELKSRTQAVPSTHEAL